MKLTERIGSVLSWKETAVGLSSLGRIGEDIRRLTDDTELMKKALLVCDELLTNIVLYSGAAHMGYFCERSDGGLLIGLYDDGAEFDPTAYIPAEKDPLDFDSGGMGLRITAQSVREWIYRRADGRNLLLFSL